MGDKKKDNSILTIDVMMIGGRRCGKTSVLAAMQSCFEKVLESTPFVIHTEGIAMDELERKRDEVLQYFVNKRRTFVPDSNPTENEAQYPFCVSLKGSNKNKIKINFVDIPGEWLANGNNSEKVKNLMAKSRILLIAIDTPHLMEEEGCYNDKRNRCFRICELVKSVGFADADKGAGMILLIPLKCERYRNDDRMDEVAMRTADAYQNLIQYVKQPGMKGERSLCQVAITPIFTMGGAEFERFDRNSEMEIIEDEKFHTPQRAIYSFPDMTVKAPEPMYCEQPLLYVLDFTLNAAQAVIKKKNAFAILTEKLAQILKNAPVNPLFAFVADFLSENISRWGGTEEYLEHAEKIRKQLKDSGDGYHILIGALPGGKN